jgi:predicted N-acetyltransferase YhbS
VSEVQLHDQSYRRQLDENLVLRWSSAADRDAILELYSTVFREKEAGPVPTTLLNFVSDLLSDKHPLMSSNDVALVEDTASGKVAAATLLLRQPVEYGGIALTMGRPEIVASLPAYRNRGLVRAVFELIHARSAHLGHDFQGITGIAYYYRQFGYEYAVALDNNLRVSFDRIPKLGEGQSETHSLRPATVEDIPLLMELSERERSLPRRAADQLPAQQPIVSVPVPEQYWRWTLTEMNMAISDSWKTLVIVDAEGKAIGYVLHKPLRWSKALRIVGFSVLEGVAVPAVLPSILRALQSYAATVPMARADLPSDLDALSFEFIGHHPLNELLTPGYGEKQGRQYAWYIRVPDLAGFITKIAPVLEQRLAQSIYAGYSGELNLDFYRSALRMVFENGRLTTAEPWQKPVWEAKVHAGFYPLTFLKLLFGYCDLKALQAVFPDVWANDEATKLLAVLFPVQPTALMPLD